jgi:hypothetical protein
VDGQFGGKRTHGACRADDGDAAGGPWHQVQDLDGSQRVQREGRGLDPTGPVGRGGDPGGVQDDESGAEE